MSDVIVSGYEYRMDCVNRKEYTFIGFPKSHAPSEIYTGKNPESVLDGGKYYCPNCDATFELSFDKVGDGCLVNSDNGGDKA